MSKQDDPWKPFSTKLRASTIKRLKTKAAKSGKDMFETADKAIKKGLQ